MSHYGLRDDLSFCHIDGHVVFLDVRDDKYFRLSSRLETAFEAHLQGADADAADLASLVEQGVLTRAPTPSQWEQHRVPAAARSALELAPVPTRIGPLLIAELCAVVCFTQRRLKARHLRTLLGHIMAQRTRHATATGLTPNEDDLIATTRHFLAARKFVPVETCCLLDSISLLSFLARRRLPAQLVFGVTHDPFTAHCWVQAQDLVLNDALGNTRAFSVVRVI